MAKGNHPALVRSLLSASKDLAVIPRAHSYNPLAYTLIHRISLPLQGKNDVRR